MRRSFVVEAKSIGVVADCMNAMRHFDVTTRTLCCTRTLPLRIVDRIGGVLCKRVQDVGNQQFLMLLLVVQPDFNDGKDAFCVLCRYLSDQALHGRIDMSTIGRDVLSIWAGNESTLRSSVPGTRRDIIRIEQKWKSLVENPVT